MNAFSACSSRPSASNVSAIEVNSAAFCFDTGANDPGGVAELAEEAVEVGLRIGEGGHHRLQRAQQRRQLLQRAADVAPAARERVAEALEVALRCLARRLVEHRVDLVELGRERGLRRGDRVAVAQRVLARALRQLDVLEAEGRAGADPQRRVARNPAMVLDELERQLGAARAVGEPDRPACR